MLSAINISPEQAAGYYYAEDRKQTEAQPQWFGRGADRLNLNGNVTEDHLRAVLYGKSPTGLKLRAKRSILNPKTNGKAAQHRAATDLTFSAPKSVSIAALVQNNQQVIRVHRQAVNKALQYLEDHCPTAQVRTNSKSLREKTDNIIAATFEHHTSRNLDPQLHTHCLVMNTTQCADGKWRSIKNDEFFKRQRRQISRIYKETLAQGLEQLGYQTEWYANDTLGIKGFTPTQLRAFSTRRTEIEAAVEGQHWKAKQVATLQTRIKKVAAVNEQQLRQDWTRRALAVGIRTVSRTQQIRPQKKQDRELSL